MELPTKAPTPKVPGVELSIADSVISEKAHGEDRAINSQPSMSGPVKHGGYTAITRSKNWTMEDAFHALDEEFWCRNLANNPQDFVAGVCRPQEGDPGYELWLELKGEIRQYFKVAAESPDKQGSHHPMTRKTICAALTAVDAFHGNRKVEVNGEQLLWEETLPKKADWIVDRFCSPFQGWNPILSNTAAVLGLLKWMDIMETSPEPRISIEGGDGYAQGDVQDEHSTDDSSESSSSIKDEHISVKNDHVLAELKKDLEHQSKKVKELNKEFEHLKEEDCKKKDKLEGLEKELKQVELLRCTVTDLNTELDRLKQQIGEQEERHKTQLEEVRNLMETAGDDIKRPKPSVLRQSPAGVSSDITTLDEAIEFMDDVYGNETEPSTTQTSYSKTVTSTPEPQGLPPDTARDRSGSASVKFGGLFATPIAKSSSPLDGGPVSLKRKASAQSSPTSPTPTGPPPTRVFNISGRDRSVKPANRASPLVDRPYAITDPRGRRNRLRKTTAEKKTAEEETPSKGENTKEKTPKAKTPKEDGK
ncbi:hypothetical protein F52700_9976 [Fusarium sp. NRRL 52700]|nr:hypothetical protein F52700_9976 [Fusarium sp. NRRL 52700]